MPETFLEWWELLSYVVTVVGFPFAIVVYLMDRRKERLNDEEEVHQRLSDEYTGFLKLVLDNSDLHLLRPPTKNLPLDEGQKERRLAIFGILISIFERAYILVYEDDMNKQQRRLWMSWEDYMREWCRREDFREALPRLLDGEDEDFAAHIRKISAQEAFKVQSA